MHYLYILRSISCDRRYIGIAEDIPSRLRKHNGGGVRSTKAYRPWRIVHAEEFRDKTEARKRELFLKKTARARKELFDRLENGLVV